MSEARQKARELQRMPQSRRAAPRKSDAFVNAMYAAVYADNASRFLVGDMLEFEASDGRRCFVTILGIHLSGEVQAMVYNGLPYNFHTTLEDLALLRIIRIERMEPEDVSVYRSLLALDEPHMA